MPALFGLKSEGHSEKCGINLKNRAGPLRLFLNIILSGGYEKSSVVGDNCFAGLGRLFAFDAQRERRENMNKNILIFTTLILSIKIKFKN